MICENCGIREAIVSYAKIEGDSQIEVHLCKECMIDKLKEDLHGGSLYDDGVAGLIENMLQFFNVEGGQSEELVCDRCGTTWTEFRKTGLLGCENCYKSFRDQLNNLIKNIQGYTRHRGKISAHAEPIVFQERELEELRRNLKDAVEKEEYEKAAVLRDEINALLDPSEEG